MNKSKKYDFDPGDEVFQTSDPSTMMRVEQVTERTVICSVQDAKTLTRRLDTYNKDALQKAPVKLDRA
jgi:hypothetical protein